MKTVKATVLLVVMVISSTSLANTYLCTGLDQSSQPFKVIGQESQVIGTLDGAEVRMSENLDVNLLAMSIKQGKLVTVIQASPGFIDFRQNNGEKASGVTCLIAE